MLFKIVSTGLGKTSQKPYANDIAGRTFFPKNADMELTAGHYAYAIEQLQTKSYAEDGETLVDLEVPIKNLIITATFPTKQEAIDAAAEVQMLEVEVKAETLKTAKALGLNEASVAALAEKW